MSRPSEWTAALARLSDAYDEIDDVYQGALREAERRDASWVKQRNGLRKAVYDTVEEIFDRDVKRQVKEAIVEMRYRFEPKEPLVRMCYYIDRINEIHLSRKIKRRNPNYAKTIIENISRCASEVLGYLIFLDDERRTDTREAKTTAATQIKEKWSEALEGPLKELAHAQAEEIIAEVEEEVGGTHG